MPAPHQNWDIDPEQTRKLHVVLRAQKVRALHALIKKGVYVDAHAFNLADAFMPQYKQALVDHQRKTFYVRSF